LPSLQLQPLFSSVPKPLHEDVIEVEVENYQFLLELLPLAEDLALLINNEGIAVEDQFILPPTISHTQ